MIAHARRVAPAECCGLLLGTGTAIIESVPAANAASDPLRRYTIDSSDHFAAIRAAREGGLHVIGAYHSHPNGTGRPSPIDADEGFSAFLFVIVGLGTEPPEIAAWTWSDGNFSPVPLVRGI